MLKIETENAPSAIGPYSQAIVYGGVLYVSGQLPLSPESGVLVEGDAAVQARQCLRNIQSIAEAAGISTKKTIKTTLLLTDLSSFAAVNAVYEEFFTEPCPARACYEVSALPRGALVEIEAILAVD